MSARAADLAWARPSLSPAAAAAAVPRFLNEMEHGLGHELYTLEYDNM